MIRKTISKTISTEQQNQRSGGFARRKKRNPG